MGLYQKQGHMVVEDLFMEAVGTAETTSGTCLEIFICNLILVHLHQECLPVQDDITLPPHRATN